LAFKEKALEKGIDRERKLYIIRNGQMKKEAFDPDYMVKLFELGYRMAAKGYPWRKIPPYYDPPDDAEPVNP
jgi:hypothetical protein